MNDVIRDFFKMESAGGILLVIAAAIAMTIANSPLGETYQSVLHTYVFGMSVSHWINDGLMFSSYSLALKLSESCLKVR